MAQVEQHAMELTKTYESGAEEWFCPVCERRFIVQWPPKYKKIILDPGDEYAVHSGGKGGVVMQSPQIQNNGHNNGNGQETGPMLSDAWHAAFDDLDFDDWPDGPPAESA